ncbi:DNA polymerase IV [Sulfurimonas sp. HSL3-7]|uniref:DNA polymerase Y family protein n=1 Tax=Sulfonitrofixus jiaomeiensis TaxID=3131938 RepID=UPI0031F76A7E
MILHLDLDSFFASAERTRNVELIGKPLIVGGRGDPFIFDTKPAKAKRLIQLNQGAFVPSLFHAEHDASSYFFEGDRIRGIVTTASYEARHCGVKTAMTIREALNLCPDAILLPPDHLLYHTLSHEMMELLGNEIPLVEQYSIDELFGDVTGWIDEKDMYDFIAYLQEKVAKEMLLPVSIGACNAKWIAKLATSTVKPFGLKVVYDEEIHDFVKDIDIHAFPGVGRAFGKKMRQYGIKTIGDALHARRLFESWGRQGRDLYKRLSGTDHEGVSRKQSRKGVGMSRSMDHPIKDRAEFYRRVSTMVRHWSHTIKRLNVNPTTFFFGIGYEHHLRSKKQYTTYRIFNEQFIQHFAREKFQELDIYPNVAILYITMSATKFLHHDPKAVDIFAFENDKKMHRLDSAVNKAREKYGMDILRSGNELNDSQR